MSAAVDLVALSLLPIGSWREVGPELRAGRPPAEILGRFFAERPAHEESFPSLRSRAAAALERGAAHRLDAVFWSDAAYPAALAAIFDPPPVLWVRGCRAALDGLAVAIVGSRAGSQYALAVAERLAFDLAARQLVIVSGLARGVDSAAHRGAVAAGGTTVAVLGCGADLMYPAEHRRLADAIAERGAVVSELPPGTPPRGLFFPRRNRIISGLSRAVVVIEAGEQSGSLITARCALEQGRDVLAVPGNVLNGRNRGGHALLRDGAKIVETADDIFDELNLPACLGSRPAVDPLPHGAADPVLATLTAHEACDLDEMAERSGVTTARLLARLFELELAGRVRRIGGGRFVRVDSSC
jgi:DNA processing protein